ncbi:hypothetical protein B7P43_G17411 [Cryptotermes secundus]|uniref:Gustatory receptor n=1 Tax=Cryptotermes secundus TaxID=105785 RepID=A0A2J7QY79_9NEOP|nr:hypothetical protein B7P43_G17411 [Cryptotermes secundus]
MKPLLYAAQLVGLAPYAYVRREQTGEESLDISRRCNVKKTIWGLLLLVVQFTAILCRLAENITNPKRNLMDLVNDMLQVPSYSTISIGALIFALTVNRKKMLEFINILSLVDRFLLDDNSAYKKQNITLLTAVTCSTITSIITLLLDVFYYNIYNMLSIITIYLPYYIWGINEIQFMNVVETLRVRLATLNRQVPLIFVQENHSEGVPGNSTKRLGRYVTTRVSRSCIRAELLRNYVRDELTVGPAQTCSQKSKVTCGMLKLSEMYDHMYEMCRLINSMYGYMTLQESTAYIVCITEDGYYLLTFLIALYKKDKLPIDPGGCLALIIWNIWHFSRLFAICLACQRVSNEVRRILDQIETLKLQPNLSAAVSDQLTLFSKQIKQCKIEFSACGFFDINLSHFFAVVLTTTTYITMIIFLDGQH